MKVELTVSPEGSFEVRDEITRMNCRKARLRTHETVMATIDRNRNTGFHRLAHRFGQLCSENIPRFTGLGAHQTIKALQAESGVGCEYTVSTVDDVIATLEKTLVSQFGVAGKRVGSVLRSVCQGQRLVTQTPKTLSFEAMEEDEFHDVMNGLAWYVSEHYWSDMEPEQIAAMVGLVLNPQDAVTDA